MAIAEPNLLSRTPELPSPDPKDSEEVALSLETAQRLLATGDPREAVRWLRRGAEAAEQAGDDLRAVALARAAADVTALAGPSLPPPLPGNAGAPSPRFVVPEGVTPVASAQRPVPVANTSTPPPPPSALRAARAKPSIAPAAPVAAATPAAPAVAARSELLAEPARTDGARAAYLEASAMPQLDELVAQGRAVRVSVKRSARDPNLYVMRRLDSQKSLPFGVKQALLLLDEADPEFLKEPAPASRK